MLLPCGLVIVRHDKVMSHRVKNCPVTESEWQTILERLFTQEPQPDIQVTATVETGTSITVTVRKSVQGITVSSTGFQMIFS
jgi:hypothetical protein